MGLVLLNLISELTTFTILSFPRFRLGKRATTALQNGSN